MDDTIEADAGPHREPASAHEVGRSASPKQFGQAPRSAVRRRLENTSAAIMGEEAGNPAFLHTIMSQVCLPYREPQGRDYIRETDRASLVITAGHLRDPVTHKLVPQGLPFGAKLRLLMLYLCTQA